MKAIHASPNNDTTNIISDESLVFGDVLASSAYTSGAGADTGIGTVYFHLNIHFNGPCWTTNAVCLLNKYIWSFYYI
ncbi:hypothetical protein [[Clostridium] fimetarium]|uniref:hypothetical protein n=1 Tax=[Clostridium] fimetarium TaxID=99656 RepID=UPI001113AA64|nr:hypothetical protein [[Clostridium] fimetarium]